MKKLLYILMMMLLPSVMFGQATKLPYACSFEDDEDLSNWVLNPQTASAKDQWIYGTSTYSEGKRSLYISDNGKDSRFGTSSNITIAYLRYKFPQADTQKQYELSFDWKCIGSPGTSMLYVMVCPETFFLNKTKGAEGYYIGDIVSSTSGKLTKANAQICAQVGLSQEKALNNVSQWRNDALSSPIKVSSRNSKEVFAIVFIWVNDNVDAEAQALGACIDNLQIASATLKKPENLAVEPVCEDSTLKVTWESTATHFLVEYRAVGSNTWRRADDLTEGTQYFEKHGTSCTYHAPRILEGSYDVRVQCAMGNDTSAYCTVNNVLMNCPENHCIDYLNLNGPNVLCTYGYHPNTTQTAHKGEDPYTNIGVLDFGPEDEMSRHTIHVNPLETDPRTDDELTTIPPGALASVRLGSWKQTGEAEAITYTLTVDAVNQGILIVKYATVVEYSGHDREGEPFFRLEVLDEHGNLIDESCGHADYAYSDAVESGDLNGWHISKSNSNIAWKEWTTVGINLQPYADQTIKVRFTTSDCYQTVHFGYAYFTVDCASAYIETENCGADAKIVCQAPEGFNYRWSDETGKVVGTDKVLEVDAGMHEYTCKVSFIEDPTCYFEVSTVSAPRFPVPDYKVQIEPSECMNRVRFINKSHIMNKYAGYENHTSEICNDQEWTFTRFSDGKVNKTSNYGPVYVAPAEGDTLHVRLRVFTGERNQCDSTMDSIIVIPSILDTDSTEYLELCQGEGYKFCGRYYAAEHDTILADTTANYAGCDSIYTLYLKVHHKTPEQFRVDSICSDSSIVIGDKMFNQTGTYTVFMTNQYGCDSVVTMNLTVNQLLFAGVTTDMPMVTCADGENLMVDFRIMAGEYDSIRLVYDSMAHVAGFRDTMTTEPYLTSIVIPYTVATLPGQYSAELEFHQFCCGVTSFTIPFEIQYRSSVVEQKWNDVLAVTSKKYNGGYEFIGYQWYKNDKPISGATGSYLYEPLDTTAYYHVVLMRGDSVAVATCPITPTVHQDISKFPTLAKSSQVVKIHLRESAQIRIFTASGQLYSDQSFGEGTATVIAPATTGAYIVDIKMLSGEHKSQYLIVGN